MALRSSNALPIFRPAARGAVPAGSARARLEALMREIAAHLQPEIISPQIHDAATSRGAYPSRRTWQPGGLGEPMSIAAATPVPPPQQGGSGPTMLPGDRAPKPDPVPSALEQALELVKTGKGLVEAMGGLSGLGGSTAAFQAGGLTPFAAAGPGALPVPATSAASASLAGMGAGMGGFQAAGLTPFAAAGLTPFAAAGPGAGGSAAAGGGLSGLIAAGGGLAAMSPLLMFAPLFGFGLYNMFADPGRSVGNALFDVKDGKLSLRDVGNKDMSSDVVRAFSLGGMSPVMQAVQDLGGSFTTGQLPGTFGRHSDYGDGFYASVPGQERMTGFRTPEEAARAYGMALARQGAISVPDMQAFEQALNKRFQDFSISNWLDQGGMDTLRQQRIEALGKLAPKTLMMEDRAAQIRNADGQLSRRQAALQDMQRYFDILDRAGQGLKAGSGPMGSAKPEIGRTAAPLKQPVTPQAAPQLRPRKGGLLDYFGGP